MANLFDYLLWRGDVPFTVDPFNEADNLLLCELAYTDWDHIVPETGESVSIQAAHRQYFKKHTRQEIMARTAYTGKAPLLMEDMVLGSRFAETRLTRYINEIDRDRECQISAVTFLLPDGTAFVAYRGTDGTVVGWKEDFDLSYANQTAGQRRAVEYLNKVASEVDAPLRVGGHSKGGHFAVYAAACCGKATQKRILNVYSNDGPGFRPDIIASAGYRAILPRIVRIVPDASIIGMLLQSESVPRVIKSSASGMVQHDGFTWQIQRNRFVSAELSELSVFITQVLDQWLAAMDDATRKSMTDTVFSLFFSTGEDTFSAMGSQKWKTAESLLAAVSNLPKEKQKELRHLARLLLQSSGQTAAARLPLGTGEKKGE
ncbi:MAG: DUF2974 domain-containing protein [Clostridia bacterium]|nr:DUF2974 domain-containing protein [Clostridia bacterium]